MFAQPKRLNHRVALAALPALMSASLVGCASSGGSHARQNIPHWETIPADQRDAQRAGLTTHSGETGAVIFAPGAEADPAWYAYQRQVAPEYDRRDGALAVGEPDPTAGWYNWPTTVRPSLNDRVFFNTGRNPNIFILPGVDGRSYLPDYRYRSYRHSPYPRRRVR